MSKRPSPSGLQKNGVPVIDWPSIRDWILRRDDHICQTCKVNVAGEVDHIWPRRLGGPDHIDNLCAICGPCNKTKGARVDLASATDKQLQLARSAIRGRLEALEAEYNDFVNEEMRRCVAGDGRSASVLSEVRSAAIRRARALEEWELVYEKLRPSRRGPAQILLLLASIDRLAETATLGFDDLETLQLLRAHAGIRQLVETIVPADIWEASRARQRAQP